MCSSVFVGTKKITKMVLKPTKPTWRMAYQDLDTGAMWSDPFLSWPKFMAYSWGVIPTYPNDRWVESTS